MATKTGKITQIIGPVIDVDFGEDASLPPIYNALTVKLGKTEIIAEVVKHLEPGKVRAISLAPTDGLERGAEVTDTGHMIEVPVGEETLGNIFDVLDIRLRNRKSRSRNFCRSTVRRRSSPSNQPRPRFLKRVLRSLTSCVHSSKAAK